MPRGRPKKPRRIQNKPPTRQFSPRGRIGRPGRVDLLIDEYETLRLTDFIGLNQQEAAASMGISQQTYGRVLKKARKTLIEGLVLGKRINIKQSIKVSPKSSKKGQKEPKVPA